MRLYYLIWVDCIRKVRSQKPNKEDWQLKTMLMMSMAMTFNLALIMSILQKKILGYSFYSLQISFIPKYMSNVFSFVMLFIVPCILINYLLIMRNKRYESLLNKYPDQNGKLFMTYFLISVFVPVILIWIVFLQNL